MSSEPHAAHHALGRLYTAANVGEFAEAARALAAAIRELVRQPAGAPELTPYLREELNLLERHPLLRGEMPAVYVSRLARGSEAPPMSGGPLASVAIARLKQPSRPSPDDFYFEDADKRPAIELCIEMVDRVDHVIDTLRRRRTR